MARTPPADLGDAPTATRGAEALGAEDVEALDAEACCASPAPTTAPPSPGDAQPGEGHALSGMAAVTYLERGEEAAVASAALPPAFWLVDTEQGGGVGGGGGYEEASDEDELGGGGIRRGRTGRSRGGDRVTFVRLSRRWRRCATAAWRGSHRRTPVTGELGETTRREAECYVRCLRLKEELEEATAKAEAQAQAAEVAHARNAR